jgi:hypothetical protein
VKTDETDRQTDRKRGRCDRARRGRAGGGGDDVSLVEIEEGWKGLDRQMCWDICPQNRVGHTHENIWSGRERGVAAAGSTRPTRRSVRACVRVPPG